MDISIFADWFFDLFLSGFSFCFDTLDSITFSGITLLDFCLWMLVLMSMIPLIFALGRTRYIKVNVRSGAKEKRKNSDDDNGS